MLIEKLQFLTKYFISQIKHCIFKKNTKYSCCQGQNPDGGLPDGDFMSEAKDWAGELISGQTGTGRILVSLMVMVTGAGSKNTIGDGGSTAL